MARRIGGIFLAFAMALTLAFPPTRAASIVASGNCGGEGDGSNLTWTLDSDGVLTISGTGKMADYSLETSPWDSHRFESIKRVTIGSSVTSIGDWAFGACRKLTGVTIPSSVASIGNHAFDRCWDIVSVTIGSGVTSIGEGVFDNCHSLTSIEVAAGNPAYSSKNGVLFNKAKTVLLLCPKGKQGTYAIPNGVTSIGDWAFDSCSKLAGVTIPSSVTSIGDHALVVEAFKA